MAEQKIGDVIHYWTKIGVAGIHLTAGKLKVGDTVHVKGHTSDFNLEVQSIQKDNMAVDAAGPGDDVGIKVPEHAREHDEVYRVLPD